jgi:hypothetical protein
MQCKAALEGLREIEIEVEVEVEGRSLVFLGGDRLLSLPAEEPGGSHPHPALAGRSPGPTLALAEAEPGTPKHRNKG